MNCILPIINHIATATNTYISVCCLFSIIYNIFSCAFHAYRKRMNVIKEKITPEVNDIVDDKFLSEEEREYKLMQLYKENHYSVLTPIFFKIIIWIYSLLVFYTLTYLSSGRYVDSVSLSFLWIPNIFEKTYLISLAIIYSLVRFFKSLFSTIFNYFSSKEKDKERLRRLLALDGINLIVSFVLSITSGALLSPIITLYLIINVLTQIIINLVRYILANKKGEKI